MSNDDTMAKFLATQLDAFRYEMRTELRMLRETIDSQSRRLDIRLTKLEMERQKLIGIVIGINIVLTGAGISVARLIGMI